MVVDSSQFPAQSSENGLFTPRAFFLKLRWSAPQRPCHTKNAPVRSLKHLVFLGKVHRKNLFGFSPIFWEKKGVFAEKGARFCGKWGLGALPPPQIPPYTPLALPPCPPPPLLEDPPLGFSSKPPPPPKKGGGGRGVGGGGGAEGWGGGGRGPIYRENEPLFRRKRLKKTAYTALLE